jgi:hypothetical protein
MFLGLQNPDPDPFVRGTDQAQHTACSIVPDFMVEADPNQDLEPECTTVPVLGVPLRQIVAVPVPQQCLFLTPVGPCGNTVL